MTSWSQNRNFCGENFLDERSAMICHIFYSDHLFIINDDDDKITMIGQWTGHDMEPGLQKILQLYQN